MQSRDSFSRRQILGTAASAAPHGSGSSATSAAPFSIVTDPALDPSFNPSIDYYVVSCTGSGTTSISTTGSGSFFSG